MLMFENKKIGYGSWGSKFQNKYVLTSLVILRICVSV